MALAVGSVILLVSPLMPSAKSTVNARLLTSAIFASLCCTISSADRLGVWEGDVEAVSFEDDPPPHAAATAISAVQQQQHGQD